MKTLVEKKNYRIGDRVKYAGEVYRLVISEAGRCTRCCFGRAGAGCPKIAFGASSALLCAVTEVNQNVTPPTGVILERV